MQTVPAEQQVLPAGLRHLHLQCGVHSERNSQRVAVSPVPGRLHLHQRGGRVHDMSRRILLPSRRQRGVHRVRGRIHICGVRIFQLLPLPRGPLLACGRGDGLPASASGILLLLRGQHRLSDLRPGNLQRSGRSGGVPALLLGHGHGELRVRE